jgi:hypothetical protein
MYNSMSFNIFEGNTILYGYYMLCHLWWYVERHITPHGLRVMALRSWRTLICWFEAPKGQRSQRACKEEIII